MKWMQRSTRAYLPALVLAAAMSLTACGPSSSDSAPGEDGAAAGGSSLGTIKVITSVPEGMPYVGVNKGNELGAWKGSGLTVDVIPGSSPSVVTAVASGDADIGLQSANKAAADIAKGLDATIVAATALPWGQDIVVSKKHADVTSPAQLKGMKFGISGFGSGGHYATLKLAQSEGWSKNDYEIVQLGGLPEMTAALESGAIDAFIWNPLEVATIEAKGLGHVIGSVNKYVGATASSVFYVRNQTLEEHPEAVRAFFEGYYGLIKKLQADPTPLKPILIDEWKSNPDAVDKTYERIVDSFSADGDIPAANLKGMGEAVTFTFDDIKAVDVSKMYTPWQDIQ
jgi:ABC-type nitrate/sulfonate/bicarbonate transport system substrate-binding protein